ncbi:hypothetical protein [Methylobacterium sp. P5_C11]
MPEHRAARLMLALGATAAQAQSGLGNGLGNSGAGNGNGNLGSRNGIGNASLPALFRR